MALDAAQQQELLKDFLGINPEEVESLDKAKEQFNSIYISKKDAPDIDKFAGKLTGSILTATKSGFDGLEFDFNSDELKGKKIEDIIKAMGGYVKGKISDLTEKVKTAGSADVQKLIEANAAEIESWKKKYTDIEGLNQTLSQRYDSEIGAMREKISQDKIKSAYSDAWKEVDFSPEFKEDKLRVNGFTSEFNSKYKIAIEDEEVIISGLDGKRLPSVEKAGFMGLKEAISSLAKENNLLKKNPGAGSRTSAHGAHGAQPKGAEDGKEGGFNLQAHLRNRSTFRAMGA